MSQDVCCAYGWTPLNSMLLLEGMNIAIVLEIICETLCACET